MFGQAQRYFVSAKVMHQDEILNGGSESYLQYIKLEENFWFAKYCVVTQKDINTITRDVPDFGHLNVKRFIFHVIVQAVMQFIETNITGEEPEQNRTSEIPPQTTSIEVETVDSIQVNNSPKPVVIESSEEESKLKSKKQLKRHREETPVTKTSKHKPNNSIEQESPPRASLDRYSSIVGS